MPKRQAVTKTRSTATIRNIESNSRDSPLLKLADEVRLRIFKYAIGGHQIHVKHFTGSRVSLLRRAEGKPIDNSLDVRGVFRHSICISDGWETEAYEKARNGSAVVPGYDTAVYHIEMSKERHQRCKCWKGYMLADSYIAEHAKGTQTLSLTLLGASRQAYAEGNTLLWTSNTFCFNDAASFGHFMTSLNPAQKKALASLQISHDWAPFRRSSEWVRQLKVSTLKILTNLTTLHLSFNITFPRTMFRVADNNPDRLLTHAEWFTAFMRFRMSSLKTLTVIISDDVQKLRGHILGWKPTFDDATERFSAQQKRQIAQNLIALINDPQGAAAFWAEEATKHTANVAKRAADKAARDERRGREQAAAQAVEEVADEGVDETAEWEEGKERLSEEEVFQEQEEDLKFTDDAADQVEEDDEIYIEPEEAAAPSFAAEGHGDGDGDGGWRMEDGKQDEEIGD